MSEPEPLDPNEAANELSTQFETQRVEKRAKKLEREIKRTKTAEKVSLSVYDTAWRRAFFWVLLTLPFIALPFWIFLGLGIFQIAGKTSTDHMQGRGYLRGSIIGFLAAIPLWFVIAYTTVYIIEHKRQMDVRTQAQQDEQDWAQAQKRIAEADALARIEERKRKAEHERKMEEERLRVEAQQAEAAKKREEQDARYRAEQQARQQAFEKQQSDEIAQRAAEREKAELAWRTQQEAANAARAQQQAALEQQRVEEENRRMQAEIDKTRTQYQEAETFLRGAEAQRTKLKGDVTAWTNRYEVAAKLANQAARAGASNTAKLYSDATDTANKRNEAQQALAAFENQVQDVQWKKDAALKRLQELGVEPVASFPSPEVQPGEVTVAAHTIKLKDGAEIKATKVVDGGDVYSVKRADGKFVTLKKADVAEIPEALLPKK